ENLFPLISDLEVSPTRGWFGEPQPHDSRAQIRLEILEELTQLHGDRLAGSRPSIVGAFHVVERAAQSFDDFGDRWEQHVLFGAKISVQRAARTHRRSEER